MRVRYRDRAAVLAALRDVAARLAIARPEIQEIRLFGSIARGTSNFFADADVLIVLEASDLAPRDRIPVYKPSQIPVPMDLTVCTRDELARERAAGNRFVERALRESVILYARPAEEPTSGSRRSSSPR